MAKVPTCKCCKKAASEILEYKCNCEGIAPEEFVKKFEGTYNPKTNYFYCSICYVKVGTPLGKA